MCSDADERLENTRRQLEYPFNVFQNQLSAFSAVLRILHPTIEEIELLMLLFSNTTNLFDRYWNTARQLNPLWMKLDVILAVECEIDH